MKRSKRALLAAGLIAGAAAMTGCTAGSTPQATKAPEAVQQQTAQPQTTEAVTEATASPEAGGEDAPAPLRLTVKGEPVEPGAIEEEGRLLLPLMETGEAMGWKSASESDEEETQTRRTVTLEKEDSRITVSWVSSDNTIRSITWQKDGLLIPVDTMIRTREGVVYVPAAFFEEAADAVIALGEDGIKIEEKAPQETPETAGSEGSGAMESPEEQDEENAAG